MNNVEIFDKLLDTLESHIEYVTGINEVEVRFILPNSKSQANEFRFSMNEWSLGKDYSLDIRKSVPHTYESSLVISEVVDKETFTIFRCRMFKLRKIFVNYNLHDLNEFIND
jgi:hypothetical protein